MSKTFTLDSTFVNLRPDDSATTLKVGPRFWRNIEKHTGLGDGRLMGVTPQKADWLAESFKYSPDFKQLVIKTRSGISWSDAKPFSAEDVAFTLNSLKELGPKVTGTLLSGQKLQIQTPGGGGKGSPQGK